MISGMFSDPRIWKIDYLTSPFWNPEKYGVKIDLHPDAFNIPKNGINPKCKFFITTEVWEIPMQKTLSYLRDKGIKIILVPREVAPTKAHSAIMFNEPKFKYNSGFYFKPDAVMAPGNIYANLWKDKVPTSIIGYPRFDVYLDKTKLKTKEQILKRHGIEKGKKIVFFPSYPPFCVQTIEGKSITFDLYKDLQNTIGALEEYALKNSDVQIIIKIHPYSQKCYNKKIGRGNEVAGLLEKYYLHPTKNIKVIGDSRNDSSIAREMIVLSDLILGYTSMMLFEGIMVEKPVIHFKFEQAAQLKDMPDHEREMKTLYSPNEIGIAIDDALNNSEKYVIRNSDLIKKHFYKIDGKFCERLCEGIKNLVK